MGGIWLCANCHSANRDGSGQCYKCHTSRATAEMRDATASMVTMGAQQATANLAAAARQGARYRSSWIPGLLTVVLWMAGVWVQWRLSSLMWPVVGPDGSINLSTSQVAFARTLALWYLGVMVGSTITWGVWMAIVVANVPALTARWTPHTSIGAFISPWIPIVAFKRPYTVVRNCLRILTNGQPRPGFIAFVWWLASLGAFFGPGAVQIYAALSGRFNLRWSFIAASQVRLALVFVTAVLGGVVIVLVELHQRRAASARAAVVMLADQPAAAS